MLQEVFLRLVVGSERFNKRAERVLPIFLPGDNMLDKLMRILHYEHSDIKPLLRCVECRGMPLVSFDQDKLARHAGHRFKAALDLSILERIQVFIWNLRDRIRGE